MNIILLGYRGSGKSSIGRKLASELWKDFVDTDTRVRKHFGDSTIAQIWQQHGQAAFRQAEASVLIDLLKQDNQVIATGGGILTHDAGRQAVINADNATRIYLSCDADVLAQRIAADTTTASERPALTANSDPAAEVAQVLAVRDPVYREVADITFDVTHCTIDEAVHHLIAKL